MPQAGRTALTLGALALLLVVAALWGWSAATEPLPAKVDRPVCVDTEVPAGDKLFPQQVTVSVYNASTREGLAGRTMRELRDRGFADGDTGNATDAKVDVVQIWTTEPDNPAVRLVRKQFGGKNVELVERAGLGHGVTVVMGQGYEELAKVKRSVRVREDAVVCSPPVD